MAASTRDTDAVAANATSGGLTRGLVRAARPRQWIKNLLVLAAPLLGSEILDPGVLGQAAIAFVAFCLAASGVYLINDARDVDEDRAHPRKRLRPVAAGIVPRGVAVAVGSGLLLAGLGMAAVSGTALLAVVATYEAVQISYCLFLKDEPVIDIATIASGFLLRAIAGGAAAGIELSQWFLLAASFGSLFMAAGKRYAEVHITDADPNAIRRGLTKYSSSYLRFVWGISAAILIMTYGLWAFEIRAETESILPAISMAPFVLAVLRYAVDVDAGRAHSPEEIALTDRLLQALALIWLVLLALAVYL